MYILQLLGRRTASGPSEETPISNAIILDGTAVVLNMRGNFASLEDI